MKVIFAGTPDFARVALERLHAYGFDIALVLTQPDRPAGRGLRLQASPVKQFAQVHGLPVIQPRSLRLDGKYPEDAAAARDAFLAAGAEAMVVAAYGLILPQWVLDAMSAAGPPQDAKAPSGGSEAHEVGQRGGKVSAAGPPQGAKAPSGGSEPHAVGQRGGKVSAAGPPQGAKAPSGGSEAHEVASVGAGKFGCFNIHASLLPRWRGAAPIHRAIEAGDAETGITIMQMDAGLDTGDLLFMHTTPITGRDTTGTLHDRLADLGGKLIVLALNEAAAGRLKPVRQPAEGVTYAHKIEKTESVVDWSNPAALIERRIRAFDPFPGATSSLSGETIKLWKSCIDSMKRPCDAGNGQILLANDEGVRVACGDGVLCVSELQRSGGKRLPAADFLRGFPLSVGASFDAPAAARVR